jgi:hypothetical protein
MTEREQMLAQLALDYVNAMAAAEKAKAVYTEALQTVTTLNKKRDDALKAMQDAIRQTEETE